MSILRRLGRVTRTDAPELDAHLPEFDIRNVTVNNARIDKFTIYFPKIAIQFRRDGEESLSEYKNRIKQTYIFDRNAYGIKKLVFSKFYTFTGSWAHFRKPIKGRGNCYLARFPLKLHLNPTRFVAHLDNEMLAQLAQDHAGYTAEADSHLMLRRSRETSQELAQYSLDGVDNYLRREAWNASQDLTNTINTYLGHMKEVFVDHFTSPFDKDIDWVRERTPKGFIKRRNTDENEAIRDNIPILDWSGWNIYGAEIYWDFKHEDAIQFVKDITPNVHRLSKRIFVYSKRLRLIAGNRAEQKENAQIVWAEIKKNVRIVVYAKTPTRVRFEVRYTQNKMEELIYQEFIPRNLRKHNTDEVSRLLRAVMRDARKRLSKFIIQLDDTKVNRNAVLTPDRMVDYYEALRAGCAGDAQLMKTILGALYNTGRVSANRQGDAIHIAMREMVAGGFMQTTGGQRFVYEPTRAYSAIPRSFNKKRLRLSRGRLERGE